MDEPVMGAYGQTEGSEDSPLVELDTTFMLASIAQTFTGAAVGVLVDQGIITLDDDICDAIGEVNTACRNPAFPDTPVTWRMLVTHRSSMHADIPLLDGNVDPAIGPSEINPTCPLDDVEQFFEDFLLEKETETTVGQGNGLNLNWHQFAQQKMGGAWHFALKPGQVKMFSSLGISYISALLPKVADGTDFRSFTQQYIFDSLGMNHTSWFLEDLPNGTITAMPVLEKNNTNGTWDDVGHSCRIDYASGQLYSSIQDMVQWAEAQLDYGINTLWSEATAMGHVYGCQEKDADGNLLEENSPLCTFGIGWEKASRPFDAAPWNAWDWTRSVSNRGSELGVGTYMLVLPESQTYVIVLLNTDGADESYFAEGIVEEGMGILLGRGSPDFFGLFEGDQVNDFDGNEDGGVEVERSNEWGPATSSFTVNLP